MTFYTPANYTIIGYSWAAKCTKTSSMCSWSVCYRTDFNVGFRLIKRK